MKTKISAILILLASFFLGLPPSLPAQEQDVMTDNLEMDENMDSDMMGGMETGGMGTGGTGMGDACAMAGGMSMMRGPGQDRGGLGLGPVWMLDLNPDQRAKLNRIQVELQKQVWSLKGKTIDDRARLRELYSVDRPDAKKIGAVYNSLFDVRRQMIEAKIEAKNRAREVLTKEQLEKLKHLQQNRMMGMSHDMMDRHGQ